MASGKRSKQQRRAAHASPPSVRGRGPVGRRQASPRVLAAVGGALALVIVGVVLAVVLGGGKGSSVGSLPTAGSLAGGLPGASDVNALLKGVRQHGLTLGSASAPVTLIEYVDLQCPYCQRFETQVMPDLIRRYVRTGKLKVEARVLDFIGPDSSRGRNGMIAAGQQGKAFDFAQVLYDNQQTENTGWLDDKMIASAAESIPGLDPRQLFAARNSPAVKRLGATFDREAAADKVSGTPTLLVGKSGAQPKQVPLRSPTDESALVQAIQAALGA